MDKPTPKELEFVKALAIFVQQLHNEQLSKQWETEKTRSSAGIRSSTSALGNLWTPDEKNAYTDTAEYGIGTSPAGPDRPEPRS